MRLKRLVPYAVLVLALAVTSACAGGPAAPSPGAAIAQGSTSGPPGSAPARTLEVSIKGSTVTPPPAQIDLPVGQTLTLVVTSDSDNDLHAHGFEVESRLVAGTPTTVTLTGREPGLYEVETHEPALTLLTVAVR